MKWLRSVGLLSYPLSAEFTIPLAVLRQPSSTPQVSACIANAKCSKTLNMQHMCSRSAGAARAKVIAQAVANALDDEEVGPSPVLAASMHTQ